MNSSYQNTIHSFLQSYDYDNSRDHNAKDADERFDFSSSLSLLLLPKPSTCKNMRDTNDVNHQHDLSNHDNNNKDSGSSNNDNDNIIMKSQDDNNNNRDDNNDHTTIIILPKKEPKNIEEALPFFVPYDDVTNFGEKTIRKPVTDHLGEPCEKHERIIRVERFGRIYKRKMPDRFENRTDGPIGTRWCKKCKGFQPLEAFYTRVKRYVCRKHHWLRIKATLEKREKIDGKKETEHAIRAWHIFNAAKAYLGYDRYHVDKTDIRVIIKHAKIPLEIMPVLCPIDPQAESMWPSNIAALSGVTFEALIKMYIITNSRALFIGMAQRCNLLPTNFDVSQPNDPWHDPLFKRVDLDIAQIFRDEIMADGKEGAETMDQTVIAELLRSYNMGCTISKLIPIFKP